MGEPVEVWRGGVMSWECDLMGHLNVGFYVSKAMEGLVGLAAELGMPHAFAPHAAATLIVREQHMRFQREAHAAARLHIEAGVLEMGEDDARVLLLMRHADGALAASFQMLVVHATSREGRPFPWPERVRALARRMLIETPEEAAPRSVPLGAVESAASLTRARELGLQRVGLGAIRPGDTDPFGRTRTEFAMARIGEDAPHLMWPVLEEVQRLRARPLSAVQLEYRFLFFDPPRLGDRFEIWAGIQAAERRIHRVGYWFLNPEDGRPWASAEGVGVCFDLDTRRSVALTEDELAPWNAALRPALTI